MTVDPTALAGWVDHLEQRHLSDLTFQEARRALQALSRIYLSKRDRLGGGGVLDGAGKRAAFALFYSPLHFMIVDKIVEALDAADPELPQIVDLGCGTAAASASWAVASGRRPQVHAFDLEAWVLDEARRTLAWWDLSGRTGRVDTGRVKFPPGRSGIVAAYSVNELRPSSRDALLARLLTAHRLGARVLIVEPIAKRQISWWPAWSAAIRNAGGRDLEWRLELELPDLLRRLDDAARMRHDVVKARSLYLA